MNTEQQRFERILKRFRLKEFRSIDGSNNNEYKPTLGQAFTNRIRIAPQELCGKLMAGKSQGLKSARRISNAIHDTPDFATPQIEKKNGLFNNDATSWIWAWGQFIDHVVAADTEIGGEVDRPGLVTECEMESCDENIRVPKNDPHFSDFGVRELTFHRTGFNFGPNSFRSSKYLPKDRRKCRERKYPNVITHWVDGSTVYGSTDERMRQLRDLTSNGRGRLKTGSDGKFAQIINDRDTTQFLFGDRRGNENSVLLSVHTLLVREHNRVADRLWIARGAPSSCNRKCNDDIFQHARAYVVGLIQKITYEEWLPAFLGRKLNRDRIGKYKKYDPTIDPSVSTEFTTAAFRVGHTIVNSLIKRVDENYNTLGNANNNPLLDKDGNLPLVNSFFLPADKFKNNPDEINHITLGLGAQNAQTTDRFVIDTLRNMLFGQGAAGADLASLNIQRGRDNGDERASIVRYFLCKYFLKDIKPKDCPPIRSFADFSPDKEVQNLLKRFYKRPENVELYVAGITEPHPKGWNMGRTFGLIIADQFKRLRDGDRFWYERYLPKQVVNKIKRTTLRDIIIKNLGVKPIQFDVFRPVETCTSNPCMTLKTFTPGFFKPTWKRPKCRNTLINFIVGGDKSFSVANLRKRSNRRLCRIFQRTIRGCQLFACRMLRKYAPGHWKTTLKPNQCRNKMITIINKRDSSRKLKELRGYPNIILCAIIHRKK